MTSTQNIPEIFNCFICMQNLTNAVLCPHCSKMCCFECVKTWLENCQRSCPHCRKNLTMPELVKCRWAQDVIGQLKVICESPKDTPESCATHGKKKKIYCDTCSLCICQYCALWSPEHKDHKFSPLDDVYLDARTRIRTQIESVNEIVKQLDTQLIQIATQIDQVKDVKVLHLKEMKNLITNTLESLDGIQITKLEELTEVSRGIAFKIEFLNGIIRQVDEKLNSFSHSQLVAESLEIETSLKTNVRKPTPITSSDLIMKDFISECIPQFDNKRFLMNSFSASQCCRQAVFSDILSANGLGWRLKVYPNGNGEVEGSFLSVFIELTSGLRGMSRFEYKLELLNENEGRNISRVYISDFEVGECWGYTRFCRLSRLENSGFITDDSLTFRFNVRSPSYYHKCLILENYIESLEDVNPSKNSHGDGRDGEVAIGLGVTTSGDIHDICLSDVSRWNVTDEEISDDIYSEFSAGEEPMDYDNMQSDLA